MIKRHGIVDGLRVEYLQPPEERTQETRELETCDSVSPSKTQADGLEMLDCNCYRRWPSDISDS